MDNQNDLTEFDKGQIVMARQLDQSISKTAGLQWSVSIKSVSRRKQWWTGDRVMGDQDSMMHVESEGRPMWSDPTDELRLLKLLKMSMPVRKKGVRKHIASQFLACGAA